MPSTDILALIPHQPPMVLLDELVQVQLGNGAETGCAQAQVQVSEKSLYATPHGVPAWIGIEYMAQTVSLYSGHRLAAKNESPKIGFLVGTRRYNVYAEYFPLRTVLDIKAEQEHMDAEGLAVFACTIMAEDVCLADARLKVFLPDNIDAFMQAYG